ncbi:MAG: AI-2E family transporter [Acidipropionibacterium acidipropionici]|nr:AI-2E family transporter [Acidipropionibacterium acidipropionici]MDN6555504.1 AI-2E family transporter [Acidipropionibacterium acidipropionici]QCV94641.1 AI-2E family transporter [Acidipropionibacterium acidipropionici]
MKPRTHDDSADDPKADRTEGEKAARAGSLGGRRRREHAERRPRARGPRENPTEKLKRVRDGVRGQLSMARAVERGDVEWIDENGDGIPDRPAAPSESLPAEAPRPQKNTEAQAGDPAGSASGTGHHESPHRMPAGLPRFTVAVLTIGGSWLAFSLLHELSSVLAPLFFALNMLITAYPIHAVLVRHRCPKVLAALVTGLTVIVMLAGFLGGIIWSVAAMVTQMQKYVPQMNSLYRQLIEQLSRFGLGEDAILERVKSINPQQILSVATSVLSDTTSVVTMVVVIITGMIFMMMDTPQIAERLELAGTVKPGVARSLSAFASGIRKYWLVTTVFGIIVALLDWAVLLVLGVPLAGVWALFSFLTNYIPNVGFVLGLVPPALLGLFDKGWVTAVIVVVAYSVLNFVVQSIIQPKFAGDAVGLTPTLSFISLLLWGWVFGALGTLIALPCSLLVKALLIDADPGARWINALISSRPQDARSPDPADH